jgi:hypothetical protein
MPAMDDLVVALGVRYSPIQELSGGVLLIRIPGCDAEPIELRLEPEWVRLFAWLGAAPSHEDMLRSLLRSNERFRHIRFGIEDGQVVLRADIPDRLWQDSELLQAISEVEHALRTVPG